MIEKELIKLTENLVRIDSSNMVGKKTVITLVKKFFEKEKVLVKTFYRNDVPSIVVSLKPGKSFDIILSGHLDVVPGEPGQFKPVIRNGKMFGRGTGDMKSGCAAMMMAMRDLSRLPDKLSIGLILTTDEETGGHNGTEFLLKKEKYRCRLAIVPDSGTELSTIITDNKGVLQIKIKAFGKSAHGSRPFWGENAIDKLIQEYHRIRLLIPELKDRKWKTTMNLGVIKGGNAVNKVPDSAEMFLDIRYLTVKERDDLLKKIRKISPNLEIINAGYPSRQDPKQPLFKLYAKISAKVLKNKIKMGRMEGCSDARFFAEMGIPTIITRPDSPNIHAANEFVSIRALHDFYKILSDFIPKANIYLHKK